jgi:hypothetical protein
LIFPHSTLNQRHCSLDHQHDYYCGYYALWAAYSALEAEHVRDIPSLLMAQKLFFNGFLPWGEEIIFYERGRTMTNPHLDWLSGDELWLIVQESLFDTIVRRFPYLAEYTNEIAELIVILEQYSLNLDNKKPIKHERLRSLLTLADYDALIDTLECLPWNNISIIVDHKVLSKNFLPRLLLARILRLRFRRINQSVILLVDGHWICLSFRHVGSKIVLLTFNSLDGKAILNEHLERICRQYYQLFVEAPLTFV